MRSSKSLLPLRPAQERAPTFVTKSERAVVLPFSSSKHVVWSDSQEFSLLAGAECDVDYFADILSVRVQTDDKWPDQRTDVDGYSDQYCLYDSGKPIGCLGVTRFLHGPAFLESYYPAEIVDGFFDRIGSSYRFRLLAKYRRTAFLSKGNNLANIIIRETWREQLAKGGGLDLINVEPRYIPYYKKLGYVLCEGRDFVCPVLNETVSVMFLTSDPSRDSVIKDLVQERDDHIFLADVMRVLTREQVYIKKTAS